MLANQEPKLSRKYQDRGNVTANKSNIQNVTKNCVTVSTLRTSDGGKKTEVEVKPSVKGAAAGAIVAGAVVGGAIGAIFGPE